MKILLVDLHNMIHRARHSFIKGKNAIVFNFFRQLKAELDRHEPDLVYLVSEGRPKHRLEISGDYKGNRPKDRDEDFYSQKKIIYELIKELPVSLAQHDDFECDDVIAYMATRVYGEEDVIIISSDTDFIQLLERKNVSLWNPIKKKFIEQWPVDYLTYKSLKGDPADNVKGVPGIGDKRARCLAISDATLERFFEKRPEAREQYTKARSLIAFGDIETDDPGLKTAIYKNDLTSLYEAFKSMNFKSLTGKSWVKWENTMERLNESRTKFRTVS